MIFGRFRRGRDNPSMPDFDAYSVGLFSMSVCSSLPPREIEKRANALHPTGTSHEWAISSDQKFRTGEPMPCKCPDSRSHRHWLLTC